MKRERTLAAVISLLMTHSAIAYETQTHALITAKAFERSNLALTGEGSIVSRLLLDRLHPSDPFNSYWMPFHLTQYFSDHVYVGTDPGINSSLDKPARFERCQMQDFLALEDTRSDFRQMFNAIAEPEGGPPLLNIGNWLVRGAIREDDMGHSLIGLLALRGSRCAAAWFNTTADQPDSRIRSLNHFYDPIHNIGLKTDIIIEGDQAISGLKSVDWALGYQNSFAVPALPAVGGARNTCSYSAESI